MNLAAQEDDVEHGRWLLMVAAWMAGCDGSAMMDPDAGAESTRASIQGEVTYSGSADGSLLIGVFPWDEAHPSQPMGPPADFVPVDTPTWPQPFELRSIRPGAYFVGAVLDVGRDSPTIPGAEDLAVYGDRLELVAGDDLVIDLALPSE
ncbi:MAG: hypothetical protein H6719_25670 [Sandaracinaceae bacterium]|nr:hypothetical protein [Sandaracinaceae bacterium]